MEQVLSLQPKSFSCRASLQESETWWTSLGLRFVRDSTQRMGSTFFWPMDIDPLGSPSLISYFILFIYYLRREKKSTYFTVAFILLPMFLLFPFSSLKLLVPSSSSKTKPMPSHSSSPLTQTKIHGWALLSFISHLYCQQSKTKQRKGICLVPKPREEGTTLTPKTHGPTANLGFKNILTLCEGHFLDNTQAQVETRTLDSFTCCFKGLGLVHRS